MSFGEWCGVIALCVFGFFAAIISIIFGVACVVGIFICGVAIALRWPLAIIVVAYLAYKAVVG